MNRKDFFKTAGRFFLLGGITVSVGYLMVNNKVSADCSVSPACENCAQLTECVNPEIKKERYGKE